MAEETNNIFISCVEFIGVIFNEMISIYLMFPFLIPVSFILVVGFVFFIIKEILDVQ